MDGINTMEDVEQLTESIQDTLSFASKLCFDDDVDEHKYVSVADVRLLYSKIEGISSTWMQLVASIQSTIITGVCICVLYNIAS